MNDAGIIRFRKWEMNGRKPLAPLPDCVAGVFMDVHYFKGTVDEMVEPRLFRALHAIDPRFEIMYDRCTTSGGSGPGFHLYRRTEGMAGVSNRRLQLEFSLQRDMTKPWPQGEPCEPGMWVIDHIRKTDKANLSGDKDKADKMAVKKLADEDAAEDARVEKEEFEHYVEFNKAIQPVMEGKVSVGLSTTNERKPRGRPRKIQVKM